MLYYSIYSTIDIFRICSVTRKSFIYFKFFYLFVTVHLFRTSSGQHSRRPGDLQVESAGDAVQVKDLSGEVETF